MDKYLYKRPKGASDSHTRNRFEQAVMTVACPLCGSSLGFHCETQGGIVWPPHMERRLAFSKLVFR